MINSIKFKKDFIIKEDPVKLGNNTIINRFSHITKNAIIKKDCMIGDFCYIEGEIGERCRIQNHNNIYRGCKLGNDVFIAPHVVITNCKHPEERLNRNAFIPDKVEIGDKTTIGANVTIIAPCKIGKNVMIGAGSIILRDIKDNEKVYGIVK